MKISRNLENEFLYFKGSWWAIKDVKYLHNGRYDIMSFRPKDRRVLKTVTPIYLDLGDTGPAIEWLEWQEKK